jgi:hypothetical protein
MQKEKIDSYVILPRSIVSDYRNGRLSIPERNLLTWLRSNGNPYGIAHVDLELLSKETFNTKVDKSYVNRLMLSLKSKRYIWYQERKGRRGSFEVHMGIWILPTGEIRYLDKYFDQPVVRSDDSTKVSSNPEAETDLPVESQKIEDRKKAIRELLSKLPYPTSQK